MVLERARVVRWGAGLLLLGMAGFTGGCADFQLPGSERRLDLSLIAAETVNPDPTGRPSPVVVRVHDLTDPALFEQADFFALYRQPESTLGANLVETWEYDFRPGDRHAIDRPVAPEVHAVGVVAAFQDLGGTWRAVIPLGPRGAEGTLVLDGVDITLPAPATEPAPPPVSSPEDEDSASTT